MMFVLFRVVVFCSSEVNGKPCLSFVQYVNTGFNHTTQIKLLKKKSIVYPCQIITTATTSWSACPCTASVWTPLSCTTRPRERFSGVTAAYRRYLQTTCTRSIKGQAFFLHFYIIHKTLLIKFHILKQDLYWQWSIEIRLMNKTYIILLGIVSLLSIDVLVHVCLNEYEKHLFLNIQTTI